MKLMAASLAALACSALVQPAAAQNEPVVVPVEKAPYHMPIFKNDLAMLLNVYLPPGAGKGAQVYHTHSRDQLSVLVQATDMGGNELGQPPRPERRGTRGNAGYTAFSKKPVTHRGENVGTTPFQNIVVALLYPEPGRFTPGSRAEGTGYKQLFDNDRARAWRLTLDPGQSAAAITQGAPGLRVVVDGGDLVEQVPGQPNRGMHVRLGDFFWQDAGTTRAVRNSGTTKLELVEFELK
jgi:hypothetical protein